MVEIITRVVVWLHMSCCLLQEEWLGAGFVHFINHCASIVVHQRSMYPAGNKVAQVRLQFLLRFVRSLPLTSIQSLRFAEQLDFVKIFGNCAVCRLATLSFNLE